MYAYFCAYRDDGITRSVKKTAAKYERALAYMYNMSTKYHWNARAEKYDEYLNIVRQRENIKAIDQMNQEVIDNARAVRFVVNKKLKIIYNQIKAAGDNETLLNDILKNLPVANLANILQASFDLERKARGITDDTSVVNVTTNIKSESENSLDTSKMTWEEKQAYHELLEKYGNK